MERKLHYINEGPGGYVVYTNGEVEIKLFFQYGGGNCVALIFAPTIEKWVKKTNTALSDRNEILTFIANQCIKDQAPNCTFELFDDRIEILEK